MKWFNVHDMLPHLTMNSTKEGLPVYEDYLVYCKYGEITPIISFMSWTEHGWASIDERGLGDTRLDKYVTHWMPLPEPPKEET